MSLLRGWKPWRRFVRDVVRGRSNVRVVRAAEPTAGGPPPIFVTGVFRSGTTLLRLVLDSHSRICCPPESNFLRALEPLVGDRDNRRGLAGLGFDEEHVLSRTRAFAAYFHDNYARSTGKARWADKTPAYVWHLDFVDRLFPDAQHLVIHRHGLDVADSMVRGGGYTPRYLEPLLDATGGDRRAAAASYWAEASARVLAFTDKHPERCHALRYEQLCLEPERVLPAAFAFLGEDFEADVLAYHRFRHDFGDEDGVARAGRGFSAPVARSASWPNDTLRRALDRAGAVLERLGYAPHAGDAR